MDKVGGVLLDIRYHFHTINSDDALTPEDRKLLKEFYLQNFIAPKARKMLEKHLAEEEAREERNRASRGNRSGRP